MVRHGLPSLPRAARWIVVLCDVALAALAIAIVCASLAGCASVPDPEECVAKVVGTDGVPSCLFRRRDADRRRL